MQIIFLYGTKFLRLAQYVDKFLFQHKKFGPAQNILRPVREQGISYQYVNCTVWYNSVPSEVPYFTKQLQFGNSFWMHSILKLH